MKEDITVFEFMIQFKDKRIEKILVTGTYAVTRSKYFDDEFVLKVVDEVISTLGGGIGAFNIDFFIDEYSALGTLLDTSR